MPTAPVLPPLDAALLWQDLFWPLLRLLLGLSAGLLVAQVLEALQWTRHLARLAGPLARAAHLPGQPFPCPLFLRRLPMVFCPPATAMRKLASVS